MTLQEKINLHLKNAILTSNEETKTVLRVLKGEMNRTNDKNLSDDKILAIIKKMIESAKFMKDETEVSILEAYLPKQLSEESLRHEISKIIQHNVYTASDMGKVMSALKTGFAGTYDGKLASTIVKELLV